MAVPLTIHRRPPSVAVCWGVPFLSVTAYRPHSAHKHWIPLPKAQKNKQTKCDLSIHHKTQCANVAIIQLTVIVYWTSACLCPLHAWFGTWPPEPNKMKLNVRTLWDTRVLCAYSMDSTSLRRGGEKLEYPEEEKRKHPNYLCHATIQKKIRLICLFKWPGSSVY